MKTVSLFICMFFLLFSVFTVAQKKDNRTFDQINDSILKEAQLIYNYDKAFRQALRTVENDRKLNKKGGEILTYPVGDSLVTIVMNNKNADQVVAEFRYLNPDDSVSAKILDRPIKLEEKSLWNMKQKIMADIQENYTQTEPEKGNYFNPVFIPFKDSIRGQELQLYKFYLLTETTTPGVIPFGRDYLYFADAAGKVYYYLQFNVLMPFAINQTNLDEGFVQIEYPKREPYITPTDIYQFRKYGVPYGLLFLKVKSSAMDIFFIYDYEREGMDITLE